MAAKMLIDKVINNNLVRSHKDGKEVLVMGKGLGFKKVVSDVIDESLIERIYVIEGKEKRSHLEELISKIPYQYVQTANEVITYISNYLDKKLDDSIWLSVTDHISFAIERAEKGIPVRNALLWEISRFYNHEFLIGKEALRIINKRHGVELPDDEAGFIALHIVNAQMGDEAKMQETMHMTKALQKILHIVKYHYGIELNESSLHYERFVTHLKYFLQRIVKGKKVLNEDLGFIEVIRSKYPNEYKCAKRIEEYVNKEFNCDLSEDELIYLSVHIRRVVDESL
ncbi:PRD domain-containing protein [Clostridium sp. C8-1-8]|uniref:BglG family transcription antiterminator LicT n=1 Tax=Clostridium sp. C8-1-8 TaxID=2698831 RepID=UPI001FAC6F36|nr:PRD domain-containing protein [Clostridium sp. C8-1-8]